MTDLPHVDYQMPASHKGPLIAIIGEAPGADEVKQGKPFVGRSGQLLNKNLAAAGIERAECFVGNVFRFQPPGNKVAHFFTSARAAKENNIEIESRWGKYGSKLLQKIFAADLTHLQKTIARLRPAIIITLGATPLWALTGREGITTLHGEVLQSRMNDGMLVLPTYHPSFIMRGNWGMEPAFLADIKKAVQLAAKSTKN